MYVDNDLSATSGKRRPEFEQLLDDRPPVVIVWHTDRLIRKMHDLERVIPLDQTIHAVEASALDLSTPAGRMVARQLTAVAQYEGEHRLARQRSASDQRAEKGLPIAGGARAFGYTNAGLEVVESEAALIREGAAALLAGISLRTIAKQWTATGSLSPAGKPWRPVAVRAVLANPRNARLRVHRGKVLEGVLGQWPEILPEDVHRGVVAVLEDPARKTYTGGGVRLHLLSGLARCGRCGAVLTTGARRSGDRALRCSATPHLERSAGTIEEFVVTAVLARLRRKDAAELFRQPTRDLTPLRTEAAALRARREALAADLTVDELTMVRRDKALKARLDEIDDELAESARGSVLGAFSERDADAVWARLDLEARRTVIRELADVIVLPVGKGSRGFDPSSVRIEWR